jgi:hypothetical protein
MFSTLRNRFGIPGVISVIALVFAMFGGAYAASNSSDDGGKATASAKAKKGPRGPKGPKGDTGPAGAQGSAGGKGDTGVAGVSGTNGTNGTSAEAVSFAGNQHGCSEGGVEIKSAKPATFVCNGKKGENGLTGFTETLPSGKTETGTWSIALPTNGLEFQAPISFPIPLAEDGEAFFFNPEKVENQEFGTSGCKWEQGNANAKPESTTPGTLCVFQQVGELNVSFGPAFQKPGIAGFSDPGFGPSGTYMVFNGQGEPITAAGTWAVTAQ